MGQYWGYHLILDCAGCDHESITNRQNIRVFTEELVKNINMVAFGPPTIEHFATHDPDKAGYSMVQLIETSNICAHFVDQDNTLYLDVFSCQEFDIDVVKQTVVGFFGATTMRTTYLTRQA